MIPYRIHETAMRRILLAAINGAIGDALTVCQQNHRSKARAEARAFIASDTLELYFNLAGYDDEYAVKVREHIADCDRGKINRDRRGVAPHKRWAQ